MNVTASLFGQMITFAVFVWVTMKYVWPPIMKAMEERQKKISDGLKAAEDSHHKLELAKGKAADILREAKDQSAELLDQAKQRGNSIVDEHKSLAKKEGKRLIAQAKTDIDQERQTAADALRMETSNLAIRVAEKVIERDVNIQDHARLIDELVEQIESA